MSAALLPLLAPEKVERAPETRVRIRFQDCDPFGHLHYARYLEYFMDARDDHLRRFYDFDAYAYGMSNGASWVVRRTHVSHVSPAAFHEDVRVQTRLIGLTPKALIMEGVMRGGEDGRVRAVAWIEFRHVDLATGRSREHAEEFMRFASQVALPLPDTTAAAFEARAAEVARAP